ncbi:MAG: ABC transporter permease [Lachnospiraceae bacterium]|nr:ABC transporter permease [Lachnospiraceae bacterium]
MKTKKNNVFTILKKELTRLFGDRKLVFSGIILQGLFIYVAYTLMGTLMTNMVSIGEDYQYRVSVVNMPDSVSYMLNVPELPFDIANITAGEMEALKEQITANEADLLVEFPADFDEAIANYDTRLPISDTPQIQIWYNLGNMESMQANAMIRNLLFEFERSMTKKFDINALLDAEEYDLNTGASFDMTFMMSLIPMLLFMLIYQGCMAIAPESIAGEKERGTLGTMLVTPARRRDMALAKVLSISAFGFLGATASFTGMALSLPNMMVGTDDFSLNFSMAEFLMIFTVLISTVLVFVALLSVTSAYAKSIKEANSYAAPFMVVSMLFGLSGMITGGAVSDMQYYFIPIFNSAQSLTAIFTSDVSMLNFFITALTNLVFTLVLVGVLAKMFGSEKIVFDK